MKKGLIFILFINLFAAFPSWYYNIKDIKERKKAFVEILLPLIKEENKKIILLRKKIIEIFNDPFFLMDEYKIAFLAKVAKEYKIKDVLNKKAFLKKIDTIPPSLALAQAAVESGWGTSRFVKEANNLYGHWEYSNKGIKPQSKYEHIDINYSLKIFPSLEDSIATYMRNLNRNPAYKEFRNLRFYYRKHHKKFNGIVAAGTLKNYSQQKEEYVKLLKKIIRKNGWGKYDDF